MTANRRRRDSGATGFVFIDKPSGCTSHDVVARARRALGTRKVGHAGTLDPLATGVLLLGVGRATKLLGMISGGDKEYLADIRLGVSTHTDDQQGEVTSRMSAGHLSEEQVRAGMSRFVGRIAQRPSAVSAIKVDGRRAHERVRRGENVELPERPVTVAHFDLVSLSPPGEESGMGYRDINVRVVCGSGTYVRALARDLGEMLGVGGHVRALRRTRLGPIDVAECTPLQAFEAAPEVIPLAASASRWFSTVPVSPVMAVDLSHGRAVDATTLDSSEPPVARPPEPPARLLAIGPAGEVVALTEVRDGMLAPVIVFVSPADAHDLQGAGDGEAGAT